MWDRNQLPSQSLQLEQVKSGWRPLWTILYRTSSRSGRSCQVFAQQDVRLRSVWALERHGLRLRTRWNDLEDYFVGDLQLREYSSLANCPALFFLFVTLAFVMKDSWQMQRSKWAKQVGWGQLYSSWVNLIKSLQRGKRQNLENGIKNFSRLFWKAPQFMALYTSPQPSPKQQDLFGWP